MQIVTSLALMAIVTAVENDKETKKLKGLQIGVKKRVDPDKCPVKSKKGDTLHMHYTVGARCYLNHFSLFQNQFSEILC